MRCRYCGTLIIHKFSGRYNRMDNKRRQQHERICDYNPRNVKYDIRKAQRKANAITHIIRNVK